MAARLSGAASRGDCVDGQGAITTTPIVGGLGDEPRLIVASADGIVHVLDLEGNEITLRNDIDLAAPVNSPLIGADDSIFVTAKSGVTRRFSGETGERLFSATLMDSILAAPNLGPDGVVYAGTQGGFFGAVCTNGILRFQSLLGSISTPAAITADATDPERTVVLVAAENGRVQAFDDERGNLKWTFFTSARIMRSAIVIDETREVFIVGDTEGFVFAGSIGSGKPIRSDGSDLVPYRAGRCAPSESAICRSDNDCDGESCLGERIVAAPALGSNRIYIATEGGRSENGSVTTPGAVHAISLEFDGRPADWVWTAPVGGEIMSSPAVIVDDNREVLIVGVDIDICAADEPAADCVCGDGSCEPIIRGSVLALEDGQPLWAIDLPNRIGLASPSIRKSDGGVTIYIGTEAGQLFEISWPAA